MKGVPLVTTQHLAHSFLLLLCRLSLRSKESEDLGYPLPAYQTGYSKKSLHKQDPVTDTFYMVKGLKLHGKAVSGKKLQEKHHDLCDLSALRLNIALED